MSSGIPTSIVEFAKTAKIPPACRPTPNGWLREHELTYEQRANGEVGEVVRRERVVYLE